MAKYFYAGLNAEIKAILLAQIRNLWTHASTAIEGNSITLGDTAFELEEGLTVHPFFDGNGRMARLLSNLPVLKAGFPPIVIPAEARQQYTAMISAYQETIPDRAMVNDIGAFPDNAEKAAFRQCCTGYWNETMVLVENARRLQHRHG